VWNTRESKLSRVLSSVSNDIVEM